MRVRFRISLYEEDKRLRRSDFSNRREPLFVALRYITEFKYLEATKWLLVSEDCWEKYILLALINRSFAQDEQAEEFASLSAGMPRKTNYRILVEKPEDNFKVEISSAGDLALF